jgi:GTP-binding protein
MPQTRFVLKKALNLGLKLIIVVNKMDRPNARPKEVVDEILELLIDLDATEEQLDSPIIYASAREGWASNSDSERGESMRPIFDAIVNFAPPPVGDVSGPFQMLVSNIDYDEYTGRIAVGKVERGKTSTGQSVTVVKRGGKTEAAKITKIFSYSGLKKVEVESAEVGEIVAVSGITGINIGETICELGNSDALPFVEIDEPVLSMTFCVNDSPFAGKEGKFVTSRHLRERLFRETDSNISLRVEETDTTESFKVSGRGELHLSVLIENMRREGYEFQVSKPVVINKIIDGVKSEPMEHLSVDVPDEFCGAVIETTSNRRGQMKNMQPISDGYTRLEFRVPSRGLIGYRSLMMNLTKGTAIINHTLDGYEPFRGDMQYRTRGSLVSFESGESVTYGLYNAQERGTLFIGPNVKVYMGMVVGENSRADDLVVNVCKQKHVSNMRASGSDDALKLSPPRIFSLEQCIDFIGDDELLEVTPVSLRMRKKILDNGQRAKLRGKKVGE